MFSLIFYAWGELAYVFIMLLSIALNYGFGLLIYTYKSQQQKSQLLLAIGVALNLALLTYFKYFNFLISQITGRPEGEIGVHLPLGISFFTFQAISYLIDVKRGDADVEHNPLNLGLYIAMFPQLIAGPIVRFKSVSKQITNRIVDWTWVNKGLHLFISGLAQKVLIANPLAKPADQIFSLPAEQLSTATAWLGSICYTLQIFFDFSGYSNMAIGLGLMLGFTFPQNFNYPYISQSVTEFWRRWHMSLSQWFRDYLYIPLGGNRQGAIRTYLNLFVVFVLCGIWHGAAWTFVIWGVYHGAFLIIERLGVSWALNQLPAICRHAYLLAVVIVGWVIFRSDSISELHYYLTTMLGFSDSVSPDKTWLHYIDQHIFATVCAGIALSIPLHRIKIGVLNSNHPLTNYGKELVILILFFLSASSIASGGYNPFIYFRF